MKKLNYIPYTGPGGPDKEQADNNTLFLGTKLKEAGIPYEEDREYADDMWGGDDLNLRITHPKSSKEIWVGYDRWGFVVDCSGDIDQDSLEKTIKYIVEWYNK